MFARPCPVVRDTHQKLILAPYRWPTCHTRTQVHTAEWRLTTSTHTHVYTHRRAHTHGLSSIHNPNPDPDPDPDPNVGQVPEAWVQQRHAGG